MELTKNQATAIGILAPIAWGMSVGLIRSVTQTAGIAGGVSLMNFVAALLLVGVFGLPKRSDYSWSYLFFGVSFAVLYELCFPLSLGLCVNSYQTIEVGMINYAWPCLTVLFAVLFNGQSSRPWLVVGLVVAFIGMALVLSGPGGLDLGRVARNVSSNPWPYGIAFLGAVLWAAFCSITRAMHVKKNPVVLVFLCNAVVYALIYAAGIGQRIVWNLDTFYVVALAASVMAIGYATWNVGIIQGRMTVLGIASYFTPMLSCLFAAYWLDTPLSADFYRGVVFIVVGSLLCWAATRKGTQV